MKLTHQTKKIMALILAPLSFLIIGYGLIFVLAKPALRPLYSIYHLISSEYGPNFNDDTKSLYTNKNGKNDGIIALSDIEMPKVGDQYGQITIKDVGLNVKLYYGDSEEILMNGAGQFQGSFMPGFHRIIMVAGHTIPYFQKFGELNKGNEVEISTHYGDFTYKITDIKVGKFNDSSMYDLAQSAKEQLIMYTCYPLEGIGFKQDRLFVYADKVSGPSVQGVS
ncbi:MAG: class D sortase [Longicatena sp.]